MAVINAAVNVMLKVRPQDAAQSLCPVFSEAELVAIGAALDNWQNEPAAENLALSRQMWRAIHAQQAALAKAAAALRRCQEVIARNEMAIAANAAPIVDKPFGQVRADLQPVLSATTDAQVKAQLDAFLATVKHSAPGEEFLKIAGQVVPKVLPLILMG